MMELSRRLPQARQTPQVVPLRGGLDLVSPAMLVQPGYAIAAQNYEVEARGYRRVTGYERMDGQPRPSDAEYYVLDFDSGSTLISEGDTVTGATSGDTGIAVVDGVLESGTYGGGDAAGYVVLYNVTGTFQDNEGLEVSAVNVATADGVALVNAADTDALHTTWIAAVTSKRRTAITAPTGSGAIRGVATYNGDKYCWRDNAGATAGVMFKATTAGWVAQTFGNYILFTGGTAEFLEGETLTGGTSGATATIQRVVLQSGAWSGTAVGYLVIGTVTGGPYNASEAITSASGAATTNGAEVAITLPAGGKYRAIEANFYAQDSANRLYFVNEVGPAMEWDGTVLAPIFTGLSAALEKPKFLGEHKLHLFLGYSGGSVQFSSTGLPLSFNATTGAGEIGFGQDLTGIQSNERDSLFITGRNKVSYLVGTSSANFDLRPISGASGAITDTLQIVGQVILMDDQGVRDVRTTQDYGDWKMGTLTRMIEPLLRSKREAGTTPVGSIRVRSKDQYRLYFSDDTAIVIYFGRKDPEVMTITVASTPNCFYSGEDSSGNEILLMGDDEGQVFELDRGTSYDGASIEAFVRTSFMNQGLPNFEKKYHRARLEGQAASTNTALAIVADFSYGDSNQPPSNETSFTFYGGGGFWDEGLWNEFNWDAQVEGQAFADLDGRGENVSVVIMSDSATESAHTLSTLTINYTRRRMLR